ncbi:type II toxin-antitoxin system PemK/MazF family toxin [Candidatus Woesearchaeota archaeon]|nr:type II toxin-antitoxin system PemK/MazF family toxin [Candidatus Woesearchaeota archaeon]
MYEQKDVVLIPFPYSDLTGSKYRPALIISNALVNKTEDRVCCLITSQETTEGIPVVESSYEKGRLPFKSWVKPQRLFTISEKIIKKRLCTVNDGFHDKVLFKLNEFLKR